MNDDADIFAISGIVALSVALGIVSLLGFTNVWVASLVVLALPVLTLTMTIVLAKAVMKRRREADAPSLEERREGIALSSGGFARAWLRKGNAERAESGMS